MLLLLLCLYTSLLYCYIGTTVDTFLFFYNLMHHCYMFTLCCHVHTLFCKHTHELTLFDFRCLRIPFLLSAEQLTKEQKLLAVETLMTLMTLNDNDKVRRLHDKLSLNDRRIIGCEIIQRTYRTHAARQEMKQRHLTRAQGIDTNCFLIVLLFLFLGKQKSTNL